MTIRVAIIGAGGMGACHARHIHELGGAVVAVVADPAVDAATALAADVGAEPMAEPTDAIARPDVDAIVVASPDRFHAETVLAAIELGKPVLCEKPLTDELAAAKAILEAEIARGERVVQVAFMRVHDPAHTQVVTALDHFGAVHHVRCVHRNTPSSPRSIGRVLVESLIHDIHTIRWLTASEIVAITVDVVERDGALRFVVATARLDSGALATIEFDAAAAGYEVLVEVTAEAGSVVSAPLPGPIVRRDGRRSVDIGDDWFAPFLTAYRLEMQAWLAAVAAGRTTGPSVWDGYAAQVVVEAGLRSAFDGGPVSVHLGAAPTLYAKEDR